MTYKIVRIDTSTVINLKGWKIVAEDGSILLPFTTKAEAVKLVSFFGGKVAEE